ncbi:MAG TPA: ABC transporter substrate-binding protein [bacterium]|nr:ABC transporter substrate-binding protein [bacterium]
MRWCFGSVRLMLVLLLVGAGLGPAVPYSPGPGGATAAASTPGVLKIGLLAPTTGVAAAPGHDMINGWQLWWSQHGSTVAGVRIDTTYYDTASNPNTALTQVRRAIERDGVQLLIGPYLANEGLAIAPYAEQHRVPLFLPTVSADDLTQRKASPYVIKVAGWSSSLTTHPAGSWAYGKGYRTALTLGDAYAFAYESVGGFAQTFVEKGGRVVKQLWTPLGTTDFSPYLSQVRAAHPDMVFSCVVGADAVHFLQQWSSFGLKGEVPLVVQETVTDQSSIRTLPPDQVLGIIAFSHYAEGRDDATTQRFVSDYAAANHTLPSYMAAGFYTAAQWIQMAVRQVHGDVADQPKFLAAVRAVVLADSPFGPQRLDSYGAPVENVYVREVQRVPARYARYARTWNVVIKTYPNVSQFWTYSSQEYLKQPVYSNSFQGIAK